MTKLLTALLNVLGRRLFDRPLSSRHLFEVIHRDEMDQQHIHSTRTIRKRVESPTNRTHFWR